MHKHYGVFKVHTDAFWRHVTQFIYGERSKVIHLEVNVLLLNKTKEEYRGYLFLLFEVNTKYISSSVLKTS